MAGEEAKDVTVKVVIDFILLCLTPIPSLVFEVSGVPFKRGFYCDDESISHPYRNDTVPLWAVALVGISVPLLVIIGTELFIYIYTMRGYSMRDPPSYGTYAVCGRQIHPYLVALYCSMGYFLFGLAINQVSTDITKYMGGRLRPNFLSVCAPDYSKFNCTDENNLMVYVTEDVCTGDPHEVQEARLSHPSGHSSCSMFCAVYLVLYMTSKLTWRGSLLLKYFISVLVIYLAWYTCLSRISDYKHHPGDVLGGAVLGTTVALIVGVAIAGLGRKRNGRQYLSDKETAVNSPMPEGNVQRNGAYRVEHNEVL